MKKQLAVAALGILVFSGPALAQLVASGDVTGAGQFTSWMGEGRFNDESGAGLDAYGRVMVPLGPNFSVQVDGAIESTPSLLTLTQSVLVGLHLDWRNPQQFMLGVMGAVGASVIDDDEDYQTFLLGVEGHLYMGDTTFFKQAGVIWGYEGSPGSEDLELAFVRAGVRHFFDDGWTADGELGLAAGMFNGYDASIFSWGVGIEKQLQTQLPISIFARYEGALFNLDYCSNSMTEQRILGGFRIAFGAPNAKAQDRFGVNTDLPRFPSFAAIDGLEYSCSD